MPPLPPVYLEPDLMYTVQEDRRQELVHAAAGRIGEDVTLLEQEADLPPQPRGGRGGLLREDSI